MIVWGIKNSVFSEILWPSTLEHMWTGQTWDSNNAGFNIFDVNSHDPMVWPKHPTNTGRYDPILEPNESPFVDWYMIAPWYMNIYIYEPIDRDYIPIIYIYMTHRFIDSLCFSSSQPIPFSHIIPLRIPRPVEFSMACFRGSPTERAIDHWMSLRFITSGKLTNLVGVYFQRF